MAKKKEQKFLKKLRKSVFNSRSELAQYIADDEDKRWYKEKKEDIKDLTSYLINNPFQIMKKDPSNPELMKPTDVKELALRVAQHEKLLLALAYCYIYENNK